MTNNTLCAFNPGHQTQIFSRFALGAADADAGSTAVVAMCLCADGIVCVSVCSLQDRNARRLQTIEQSGLSSLSSLSSTSSAFPVALQ